MSPILESSIFLEIGALSSPHRSSVRKESCMLNGSKSSFSSPSLSLQFIATTRRESSPPSPAGANAFTLPATGFEKSGDGYSAFFPYELTLPVTCSTRKSSSSSSGMFP